MICFLILRLIVVMVYQHVTDIPGMGVQGMHGVGQAGGRQG